MQNNNEKIAKEFLKTVRLPMSTRELKNQFKRDKQKISENDLKQVQLFIQRQNFDSATIQFYTLVKKQLFLWKEYYKSFQSLEDCIQNFIYMKQLNIDKIFITKLKNQLIISPNLSPWDQIIAYIKQLFYLFVKIGNKYMNQFQLQSIWKQKRRLSQLNKLLLEIYKKYFYFYNKQLYQKIEQNLKKQISIHFEVVGILQDQKNPDLNKRIKMILNQYKQNEISFKFLNISQKKYLHNSIHKILDQQNKQCFLSITSKQKIKIYLQRKQQMKLSKQLGQSIEVWDVTQEINLQTMVMLFKLFNQSYCGIYRHFLKFVFRKLNNFKYSYSNFHILILLENLYLNKNDFVDQLRKQNKEIQNKISQQFEIAKKQSNLLKSYQSPQYVIFQFIQKKNIYSRTINILIQNPIQSKEQQKYKEFLTLFQGETYLLKWVKKEQKGWKQNIKQLVTKSTYKKTKQETILGYYLGHILPNLFKGYLINLIGVNIGCQVIRSCQQYSTQMKTSDIIYKIIFFQNPNNMADISEQNNKMETQLINCNQQSNGLFSSSFFRKNQYNEFITQKFKNIQYSDLKQAKLKNIIELDNDRFYYDLKKNLI